MHCKHLQKHRYPIHIKLFGLSLLVLFLYVTPLFFWTEFNHHCAVKKEIDVAEKCFREKDYSRALELYAELLEKYEHFDKAKTRITQSCFACSDGDPALFEYGLYHLRKGKYKDSEINELAYYLPTDELKKEFKSIFVKA